MFWRKTCNTVCMDISLKLEAPWIEVKEKLKEIVHSLTDEDLQYDPS
jgi:hypothetical protein